MKPIFTIDAAEYLVATELEKSFRVWIPSKDTGIDLLVSNGDNSKTVSIQVKYSKDHNLRENIRSAGWFLLLRNKIEKSTADLWVFLLYSMETRGHDCIVIKPKDLLSIFDKTGRSANRIDCYMTVTTYNTAFETRKLSTADNKKIGENKFAHSTRDLTKYLNNWSPINKKLS